MSTAPFSFDTDFRREAHGRRVTDVDVATAREQGFADGFAQGRAAAAQEAQAALTHMAGLLAQQAQALLGAQDERFALVEQEAAALAVLLARRIAGAALAERPDAMIELAARECLQHARSAPHLAVRVHVDAVTQAEGLFGVLAHESGFAGKVVVLGEPEIAPGDARLEWADGGVVIDRGALDALIDSAARQALGAAPAQILA
jgi:flagellar assembly protein FliH